MNLIWVRESPTTRSTKIAGLITISIKESGNAKETFYDVSIGHLQSLDTTRFTIEAEAYKFIGIKIQKYYSLLASVVNL